MADTWKTTNVKINNKPGGNKIWSSFKMKVGS